MHPEIVWVGSAAARRRFVVQAYEEHLAGTAASKQGLQCGVQALAQLSQALVAYNAQIG